jgi:hypothetical protein
MRGLVALVLGALLAANGALMLAVPAHWYGAVPGVADAGPLNPHFVRDIGCAYLVAGGALVGLAWDPRWRMAALAGGAFLALHALVHLLDWAAGREGFDHLLADLPAVFVAPLLALWLAVTEDRHAAMAHRVADRPL